jgi:hypothetical protein
MKPYHLEIVTYFFINPAKFKGIELSTVVLRPSVIAKNNTRKHRNSKEIQDID